MQDNDIINEYANYANTESQDKKEEDPKKKDNKEKDAKLSLMLTQLIICALALLTVFAIKLIGGTAYSYIRAEYIDRFEKHTTIEDVTTTLAHVFDDNTSSVQSYESAISDVSETTNESTVSEKSSSTNENTGNMSSAADVSDVDETKSEANGNSTASLLTDEGEEFLPDLTSKTSAEQSSSQVVTALPAGKLSVGSLLRTSNTKITSANSMAVPVNGEITSLFGLREHPVYGEELFHAGIDIGADQGSEIYAALAGTVIKVAYDSGYGNFTIISHTNGLKTLYAHCSKINVNEGDEIEKGQTIALVGSTGVSTGPHLHFEVILNGTNLNPLWFL